MDYFLLIGKDMPEFQSDNYAILNTNESTPEEYVDFKNRIARRTNVKFVYICNCSNDGKLKILPSRAGIESDFIHDVFHSLNDNSLLEIFASHPNMNLLGKRLDTRVYDEKFTADKSTTGIKACLLNMCKTKTIDKLERQFIEQDLTRSASRSIYHEIYTSFIHKIFRPQIAKLYVNSGNEDAAGTSVIKLELPEIRHSGEDDRKKMISIHIYKQIGLFNNFWTREIGFNSEFSGRDSHHLKEEIANFYFSDSDFFEKYMSSYVYEEINQNRYNHIADYEIDLPALQQSHGPFVHFAIKNGRYESARSLMNLPCIDINQLDSANNTCLTLLVQLEKNPQRQLIKNMLEFGVDVDKHNDQGHSALSLAIKYNNADLTRTLLRHGASTSGQYDNGASCLHLAIQNDNYDIFKALLDAKCDVHALNNDGRSALAVIFRKIQTNSVAVPVTHNIFFETLAYKMEPTFVNDAEGNTTLHYAAHYGNADLIKYLVTKGGAINQRNNKNETPLQIAILRLWHDEEIMEYLYGIVQKRRQYYRITFLNILNSKNWFAVKKFIMDNDTVLLPVPV